MKQYARILHRFRHNAGHVAIATMPVFSNVGEAAQVAAFAGRSNQVVIFGNARRRTEIYTQYLDQLIKACRIFNFETIVDLGEPLGTKYDLPLPLIEMGKQSAEAISALLSNSRAGFLTYFDGYLAKSGVFAAYCAHGTLPIMPRRNASEADGIRSGHEYLLPDDIASESPEAVGQQIAMNAHEWYRGHSIAHTAAKLAAMVMKSTA